MRKLTSINLKAIESLSIVFFHLILKAKISTELAECEFNHLERLKYKEGRVKTL